MLCQLSLSLFLPVRRSEFEEYVVLGDASYGEHLGDRDGTHKRKVAETSDRHTDNKLKYVSHVRTYPYSHTGINLPIETYGY